MEVDVVSLAAEFPNDNPELHRGVSWVCLALTGPPVAILPVPVPVPVPELEPAAVLEAVLEAEPVSVSVAEILAPAEPTVEAPVDAPVEPTVDAPVEEAPVEEAPVPEPRISGIVTRGEVQDLDDEDDGEAEIVVEELPPLDDTASVEGAAPVIAVETAVAHVAVATSTALPPAPDDPFTALVSTLADVAIGAGSPYVASLLPALLLEGRLDHELPADAAQALAEADVARGTEVTAAFIGQTRAWRAILAGTSDDFAAAGNAMLDEWAAELLARLLGAPSRATALRRELRSHGVAAFGLVEAA